ncbi:helix-turn-helix transcriptional regulator [Govanella unica]|uniref:Helix-turn-helix domain-containing protein n=1 Tax=Govanella unica TaxID=2975056 RepID=A0A9X3TYA8_9PROT|nr:helix-turn-helix domain-containing protein [Govania unica]MDA5193883.1 helix-turn-helix domain-containing protein [Govania unica]
MKQSLQAANDNLPAHRLLNEKEAAILLGFTIRALQNWRVRGGGPRFVKVSARSVRYRPDDLQQWIEDRLVSSTSDSRYIS